MRPEHFPALPAPEWAIDTYDPESRMRRDMRRALIALAVLVFGFGLAAALVPIGGAVVGGGQVGVESRVKRVAHPTGGVIAELFVRNGDHVAAGAPLVRLDDTVSGSESSLTALSVDQLLAQRARLEAERLGSAGIAFPAQLANAVGPGAAQAMADELRLFGLRRSEQAGLRAQIGARVVQNQRQIDGYNAQIRALQQQAALIEPERQGVKELWEKDLVTISRRNELERTSVDLQGSIAALRANIAQTRARVTEARVQMIQLGESRRADAGTQLAAVNSALNEQQVRSVSAGDLQTRSLIRAPYAGVVDKLAFATIGDVVRPAETLMEIVPDQDRLLVEAAISPGDIDQVRAGQPARIRFTAFNSTASPEIAGAVAVVAPERTTDPETKSSFYAVRVAIAPSSLARWPELKLKPGMPAEVFIETGSRSMLSYLTKPLRDQFARAFRDN